MAARTDHQLQRHESAQLVSIHANASVSPAREPPALTSAVTADVDEFTPRT